MPQDKLTTATGSWRDRLIDSGEGIGRILGDTRRIAVLGIKTADAGGPAYDIPQMLQRRGYEIIPVPVYFPDVRDILGVPVVRSLAEIAEPVDMVLVFRRATDIPQHIDDILAASPKVVWMQLGIHNDDAAQKLAEAGIEVVQDRCIRTEMSRRQR